MSKSTFLMNWLKRGSKRPAADPERASSSEPISEETPSSPTPPLPLPDQALVETQAYGEDEAEVETQPYGEQEDEAEVETQPYGEQEDEAEVETQPYGDEADDDLNAYWAREERHVDTQPQVDEIPGAVGATEDDSDVEVVGEQHGATRPKKSRKHGHSQKFDQSWKASRPWLKYTAQKGMECEWCTRHISTDQKRRNQAWTERPCVSLRLDVIKRHEQGTVHQQSARQEMEVAAIVEKGGIGTALQRPVALNRKAILGALRAMYWIAKNELPVTTKFKPLLGLLQSLGCDYLNRLRMGGGSYTSEQAKQEFLDLLAADVCAQRLEDVKRSPYYSLLIDESTDISNSKQLIMYLRYLDIDGKAHTTFFAMTDISNGKADTIFQAIQVLLDQNGLPLVKLAGFGSDGASVMVGRQNGVAAKLKEIEPALISVHCVAHRLALGVSQAATGNQQQDNYISKFKRILGQLYSFFSKGPVRAAGFKEIQNILDEPTIKLVDAKDVRWLSHNAAVTAIRRTLPALIPTLEREATERGDALAQGLARTIKRFNFLACTCMMSDILPLMTSLSKHFQRADLDFTSVGAHVDSAIRQLTMTAKGGEGPYMKNMGQWMATLDGVEEFTNEKFHKFVKEINDPFVDRLIVNLDERFEGSRVLQAFREFDPRSVELNLPIDDAPGNDLEILSDHFQVPQQGLRAEWGHMRRVAAVEYGHLTLQAFLRKVVASYTDVAPIMAEVMARALVVPVTTADCERGFSAMNRVKSRSRNNLSKMLEAVLWIVVEGPTYDEAEPEFFERVANKWAAKVNRRLTIV